ncbi:MAG: hypothetical protein HPZ91_14540 [Lentisphaeria bacterium]|nr:hypothetical protein [Lentisphaeria bacterium]
MKKLALLLVLAGSLFCAVRAAELDPLLQTRPELWKMSGDTVMQNIPDTFAWMDKARTRLRFNARTSGKKLSLFGQNVQEAIFDFREGRVGELTVSVYNRGDAGEIMKKSFEAMLDAVRGKIQGIAGEEAQPQSQNASVGGSRLRSLVWKTDKGDIVLRWSLSRSQPEYIAVDFYRPGEAPKSLRDGLKTTVGSSELEEKVKTDGDGSHYMLIPMVDQGAKGYCVAATVERVLRYYGSNLDQHVIAKLAESDAQKGTNINKIVDVLASSEGKLGIRFKRLYQYELDNLNDLKKVVKDYNTIARRMKLDKIDLDDYLFIVGRTRYLDFGSLMKAMDFKVFREVRKREIRDNREFLAMVKENIDNGVPLCWSTFIFPGVGDSNSSEFGMHMRIITGYNEKTGEIIFSDSWGAGHEKKTLKNEDAWGITVNVVSLEPRRRGGR